MLPDAAALLAEYQDRVRRQYGQAIGRDRSELVTPALVLDIDAAQRNVDRMAKRTAPHRSDHHPAALQDTQEP